MPTDQINKLLRALTVQQRWTIGIVSASLLAGIFAFLQWQRDGSYRPLFTDLAPEDAGPVVQKLKEDGISYRLSNNGATISVPDDKVPELRLEMAGAGLPKSGRLGFELFDKTNFGITEFAEHVNYRRALEGELERSVMSVAQIEQARVHISMPQESVFLDSRQPAKASVLIKIRRGAILPDSAVPAITNLVASAVEGLAPESVSVLDMRGNLLNRPKRADATDDTSSAALEYRQKVERDLTAKLDATLEPLLGAGRFRTAVSADCEMKSGEQSEETFDPDHSVMVSSQKTEDISSQSRAASGVPGTAANLPDETRQAAPSPGTSRKTENISYQTSHTVKRTVLPQGAIQRLSISVLLDYAVQFDGGKRVLTAPDPERLKVIHDLVAAAAGLNTERGDQLIVESLPFESTLNLDLPDSETPATAKSPATKLTSAAQTTLARVNSDPKLKIGLGALLALIFCAGIFAFFKKNRSRKATAAGLPQLPPQPTEPAGRIAQRVSQTAGETPIPAAASQAPALAPARSEVLAVQGRNMALQNTQVSVSVLRSWLKEGA